MPYDPARHHRRSIRLAGYDYPQPGAYFVTICTHQRACFLAEIIDGAVHLTEYGAIVQACWAALPDHYSHVALDAFVIMPNHVHGIIVLADEGQSYEGGSETRPYGGAQTLSAEKRHSLPEIVRAFKAFAARRINEARESAGWPVWQRTFYDHVIRDDPELQAVQAYITLNPDRWAADRDNPLKTP